MSVGTVPLQVKVWGPFACFTRPEMKVERVSYDVMTPSAARGILEAIFWKPEFAWRVQEIWVLNPIKHISLLRNEITDKQSARAEPMRGGHYLADEHRAQRYTLALRDVAYLIRADVSLRPHCAEDPAKYRDQFRRRVQRGQCFHHPYLGTREFAADFGPPDGSERPRSLSDELGLMLFDQVFAPDPDGPVEFWQHSATGSTLVKGEASPRFFQARVENGVLRIPPELYEEVN